MKSESLSVMKERDFYHAKVNEQKEIIRKLEYDNAELVKANEQLRERCKLLASRQPEWPKGYRPTRRPWQEKKKHEQRH